MSVSADGPYRHVQGLSRGLAVLHAISRTANGCATIGDLSTVTGLHRTTVQRLLKTLETEGYVRRSASDGSYRLAHKIRQLGDGFTDDEWISEIAAPVLGELLQKLIWPSDLCTIDGTSMLVRETTHRFSPLSFHRAMVRQRMPVLSTAAGRAYLAHCGPEEREEILRMVVAGGGEQAAIARNRPAVERIIERVHRQGYASNDGEWTEQSKVGALALALGHRGRVLGAINVVFLKKAVTIEQAAERYLPPLRAAVARIDALLGATPHPLIGE
ncbi:IclR family mhp operon transcriptional activator [Azospirillum fermentarium]|uniref:DNA-binding transcriptional regulator n=1 Tax=Azospirillum fermentarium TaxID=1233114 RepID=UPI0022280306|nr:DNA-binding transcriptional regulator [Azospirillum fermentarium]MCW2248623.1 IclR family mhp operon transcriptional activator [Azospirillum fermentarium]